MTTLTRWSPWGEMPTLRRAFERFLEDPLEARLSMPWWPGEHEPAVDVAGIAWRKSLLRQIGYKL